MFPRSISIIALVGLILLSDHFAYTQPITELRLPSELQEQLLSKNSAVRRDALDQFLDEYPVSEIQSFLNDEHELTQYEILLRIKRRNEPLLSSKLRGEYATLMCSRHDETVILAMELAAKQLFFDQNTAAIEKSFLKLLDHENLEIVERAMFYCMDYGLHTAPVVEKTFSLLSAPEFQKTKFYSRFVKLQLYRFDSMFRQRQEILEIGLREIVSRNDLRRNLATEILMSVEVDDEESWTSIFNVLTTLPDSLSSKIIISRLDNRLFLKAVETDPALHQKLEKYLERLVKTNPQAIAVYRIRQAGPHENIEPWAELLLSSRQPGIVSLLEKHGYFPSGTSQYMKLEVFQNAPELIPAWKKRHPTAAGRLDKLLKPMNQNQVGVLGGEPDFFFPDTDSTGDQLPSSELPFLHTMIETENLKVQHSALMLLLRMGQENDSFVFGQDFGGSLLSFQLEPAFSKGLEYPPETIAFLARLLHHDKEDVRLYALAMLMCSGQNPTAFHYQILHSILEKALEETKYDDRCLLAIKLLPYFKNDRQKGEQIPLSIIRSQHQHWNDQSIHCACFTCVPFRNQFLQQTLKSLESVPHRNDDWLKELALLLLRGNSKSAGHWEYLCAEFLATTHHKSSSAAKILWISYQISDHKELKFDDEQSGDIANLLKTAVNLAESPSPYLMEWIRYLDRQLTESIEEGGRLDDVYVLPQLLIFSEFLHDHPETWNLLEEKSGRAFLKRTCELLAESNSDWEYALSFNFNLLPLFQEVYPDNPLRRDCRLRQHEYFPASNSDAVLYGSRIETLVWNQFYRGELFSDDYRPLLFRISRSSDKGLHGCAEALLALSVIEPDNEAHWDQLVELARHHALNIEDYRRRRDEFVNSRLNH